ncbi:MAG: hypothetical protein AVDCRST_MAG33-1789, partial [uncultured Thermomicrobiales bacterium]
DTILRGDQNEPFVVILVRGWWGVHVQARFADL